MLRLLSPLFRRIPCLLAAAGLLAACSPTLNWRDVDVGPQTRVQFPCRPEHAERSLVLAGAPMRAGMWVCDAGGLSWSVTVLDVSDPARLTTVLREARRQGRADHRIRKTGGHTEQEGRQRRAFQIRPDAVPPALRRRRHAICLQIRLSPIAS